jgi:hypothetical protein
MALDPRQVAMLTQNAEAFHSQNQQQTAPKKKGNFLTNLLPTIGGIAGGGFGGAAGGALAGTAILPGVGTAVGGLLGALLGGAAGGSAGKVAENKIEGNALGDGVLGAGIENGVFSAGPLRLLKGAKAGIGAIKAGSKAAPSLVEALGASGGQEAGAALKTSMAGKLDAFGNKQLGKSQFGVLDKPTIRTSDPAGTTKKLYNMGLTKNTDIERTAQAITGADGVLNKAVAGAVSKAGGLEVGHLPGTVESAISKSGIVDSQAKGLTNEIMADVKLIDPKNPKSALDVMRNLKSAQQQYLGKGGTYHLPTSLDKKRAKVIGEVHDEIQNTLYNKAGANNNLSSVLTPAFEKQLLDLHPGNAQWAAHVKQNIMGAKSVGDLRSAQAPFVNATKLIENGEGNAYSAGGQLVNNTSSLKGMVVDAATNLVKNPAQRVVGQAAKKAAPLLPGGAQQAGGLTAALTAPTTKQIVRNGIVGNTAMGMLDGGSASAQGMDAAQTEPSAGAMPGLADVPQQPTTNNPFAPENAQANIQKILAGGGTAKDVTQYISLVQAMQELSGGGAGDGLNAQAKTSLAASSNGISTLDQLEGLFGNAGNGSGKLGGALANLSSKAGLNSNVQTYNDLAASSVSQLAKALNGGGQVSDTDAAVVIQALPKITDSPQVARNKFNALKARLQTAQQNTLRFGAGGEQVTSGAQ